MHDPSLSPDDIEALRVVGLSDQQLEALSVCHLIGALLAFNDPPPMGAVRRNLLARQRGIAATLKSIEPEGGDDPRARDWASILVREAQGRNGVLRLPLGSLAPPEPTLQEALRRYLTSVDIALADLPAEQNRHRADPFFPKWIDIGLQLGSGLLTRTPAGHLPTSALTDPPRNYAFRASSNPSSRYYKVVAICARAASGEDQEPERAIKAYVKALART